MSTVNFEERIEKAQEEQVKLKGDIAEMMATAEMESRDLDESEVIQLDQMSKQVETLTKRIENMKKAEKALGMKAAEEAPAIIQRRDKGGERPKGDLIFKQATAAFIASQERKTVQQVVAERYSRDEALNAVVKTAVNPAQTDVTGWAEELVDDALQGFQDILRGESIAGGLLAEAGFQLNFDMYGAIKIPQRAGTDRDLASAFTGETDAIPVRRATTALQTISPYKWGVISTFSKELAMRSTPQIESLMTSMIVADTATQLDFDFLGTAAAVAAVRPAGMFNGVTGTAAASGGTLAENVSADLSALVTPILDNKMGRTLRILIHPSNVLALSNILTPTGVWLFRGELQNGMLNMYDIRVSHNVPKDELWAIDMSEIAWAPGAPQFTVSDTATIVEVNDDGTPPTMGANETPRTPSGSVGDSARDTVNNPPIRSLFQTESVAVKHVSYLSWHKMRAGCVNRITGVAYAP